MYQRDPVPARVSAAARSWPLSRAVRERRCCPPGFGPRRHGDASAPRPAAGREPARERGSEIGVSALGGAGPRAPAGSVSHGVWVSFNMDPRHGHGAGSRWLGAGRRRSCRSPTGDLTPIVGANLRRLRRAAWPVTRAARACVRREPRDGGAGRARAEHADHQRGVEDRARPGRRLVSRVAPRTSRPTCRTSTTIQGASRPSCTSS